MITSLLPPNSTGLERALDQATARLGDVPAPIKELWNPYTCPIELLPWLAWALSVDRWEPEWSEAQKRDAVAIAIELQRKKGTPASVEAVLASFDELLRLVEWFEMSPPGEPHTFVVDLPLVGSGGTTGGYRTSIAFAEAVIRDVIRTKPLRSHFTLRQVLEAETSIDVIGAARASLFERFDTLADTTIEAAWLTYLQTETGEPITDENGNFIEGEDYDGFDLALDFVTGLYRRDELLASSIAELPGYVADPLTIDVGAFPADCILYGKATAAGAIANNTPLFNFLGTDLFFSAYTWAGALAVEYWHGAAGWARSIPLTASADVVFVIQKDGDALRVGYRDAAGDLVWTGAAELSEIVVPDSLEIGEGVGWAGPWGGSIAGLFLRPGNFTDAQISEILEAL